MSDIEYIGPLDDEPVDPARVDPLPTSRRVACVRPVVASPIRAIELRGDGPVFPNGAVRRLGVAHGGDL